MGLVVCSEINGDISFILHKNRGLCSWLHLDLRSKALSAVNCLIWLFLCQPATSVSNHTYINRKCCTVLNIYSFLRQVHSPFQSHFSIQCVTVLPLSISSIISFSYGDPVAAYVFFLFFPSVLFLLLSFLQ